MLVAVELPAVRIPAQPAVLDVVATKETLAVIVDMSPEQGTEKPRICFSDRAYNSFLTKRQFFLN